MGESNCYILNHLDRALTFSRPETCVNVLQESNLLLIEMSVLIDDKVHRNEIMKLSTYKIRMQRLRESGVRKAKKFINIIEIY